ncbi:MAG: YceD family protein [Acidiferrobacteraceae bacterium]
MGRLPARIDPIRLANDGARLHGVVPVTALPRLASMCERHGPEVEVDLTFERSSDGTRYMRGAVSAPVWLTCRRCLGSLHLRVEAVACVIWSAPGAHAESASGTCEVLVADGMVDLATLIEDELLLAWPMFPAHADEECVTPPKAPDPRPGSRIPPASRDRSGGRDN